MFSHTKPALHDLQNLLRCRKCTTYVEEIFRLGQCEHHFCRKCADDLGGKVCPVCDMPSRPNTIHMDRQLSNIAALCARMTLFLNDESDEYEVTTETEQPFQKCSAWNAVDDKIQPMLVDGDGSKKKSRRRKINSPVVKKDEKLTKQSKRVRKPMISPELKRSLDCGKDADVSSTKKPSTPTPKKNVKNGAYMSSSKKISTATTKKNADTVKYPMKVTDDAVKVSTPSKNCKQPSSAGGSAKKKSSLTKRNAKGETPLQVATIKGNLETVKHLLEEGANPNVKDNAGWTPLHEAVNNGDARITEMLLDYGTAVNAPGLDNDTPLHDAVANGRVECIKLLVARGANTLARNIHGITPLALAQSDEIREILLTDPGTQRLWEDMDCVTDQSLPVYMLASALSQEQTDLLQKCAKIFDAKILEEHSHDVTHLITAVNTDGACPRTLKYLHAILAGNWILNPDWLQSCLKNNQREPEDQFEVKGCSSSPDVEAPRRARQNTLKQLPGLFDGCQFFFHGKFQFPTPSREQLIDLVKRGGGTILTREPRLYNLDNYPYTIPYHAPASSSLADCAIFVIYDDNRPNPPHVAAQRMSYLPASWIMDSIAAFSLLEKTLYLKQ